MVASGLLQRRFDGEDPHILGVLDLQNMLIGQIVLLLYVCLHRCYFEGRHLQFFVYNVLSVGLGRNELTFRHKTRRDDPLFLFVACIFAVDYCLGRFDQQLLRLLCGLKFGLEDIFRPLLFSSSSEVILILAKYF